MNRNSRFRLLTFVVTATWVLWGGGEPLEVASDTSKRVPVSAGKLVAWEPLSDPAAAGEMCAWEPVGGSNDPGSSLHAREFERGQAAQGVGGSTRTVDFSQRQPVRKIQDSYSAFSSVAVDPINTTR
jgi:hypothetical protein